MEKSRSWSSAHDWKSCNRQKRFESSNLSFSATSKSLDIKGKPFCIKAFLCFYVTRCFSNSKVTDIARDKNKLIIPQYTRYPEAMKYLLGGYGFYQTKDVGRQLDYFSHLFLQS